MTFEEAKQKVAEKNLYATWKTLANSAKYVGADMDVFYREVSELMAQSAANEAVREDRKLICYYLNAKKNNIIEDRPLPFPDAK